MADTEAQRTRRARAHKRGDHSLCVAGRCPAVGPKPQVTEDTGSPAGQPVRDPKATERQLRYRRHKDGDHSLCLVGNCKAVTAVTVTDDVTSQLPVTAFRDGPAIPHLEVRGQKLFDDMTAAWVPNPIYREQLIELCRMADRLEKLDRQLRGEDWLRFWARNDDGSEVTVFVDKVLSEARELQTAFRALGADLVKALGAVKAPVKGGGKLASITSLLDAKRPAAG
jgi:hypothetical protein